MQHLWCGVASIPVAHPKLIDKKNVFRGRDGFLKRRPFRPSGMPKALAFGRRSPHFFLFRFEPRKLAHFISAEKFIDVMSQNPLFPALKND